MKFRHNGRLNRRWRRARNLFIRNFRDVRPSAAFWIAWWKSARRQQPEPLAKYIMISDGRYAPCAHLFLWGSWFEDVRNRQVETTDLPDGRRVSTIFLGLDHNWYDDDLPVLFETMVFKDANYNGHYQQRYTSKHDALVGHATLVERLSGS